MVLFTIEPARVHVCSCGGNMSEREASRLMFAAALLQHCISVANPYLQWWTSHLGGCKSRTDFEWDSQAMRHVSPIEKQHITYPHKPGMPVNHC